jgi:hypothetical protein
MLIPLRMLLPRRMIGTFDSFLALANASRTKSHLNQIMAANNKNRIPKGFRIRPTPIASHQNAPNAKINAIAVATILETTVNLGCKTVRLTTKKI